jgi:hypothetical protein
MHELLRKNFILLIALAFLSSWPAFTSFGQQNVVQSTVKIAICGNNVKEANEVCDGTDLAGKTCQDFGYTQGALACGIACDQFDISACYTPPRPPSGGGGGGAPAPSTTRVLLQGKAYPNARITVLVDGRVTANITADSLANFKTEMNNISAGTYNFGLWAQDQQGRRSITFSFAATVRENITTTIFDIFLPPTIELDRVNLLKGEDLTVRGTTAPESTISIHVESPQEIIKKTVAGNSGDWSHFFDTSPLEEGAHTSRVKAESSEGLVSSFSSVMAFYVGRYGVEEVSPRADFNRDGRTNLIDFSIMLYWWGKYNPAVDMNQDGMVNLTDFSILMYYWSG